MLGNDVIDLQLAAQQSNWRRKNYLSKIFSAAEQRMVYQANDPDLVVWLLWSMKEAAYKIVNRKTKMRFYDPLAFNCVFEIQENSASGTISYKEETFNCTTEIEEGFLHTVAVQKGINLPDVKIIHRINRSDYLQIFNSSGVLRLEKDMDRLPKIINLTAKTNHLASISHHGKKLSIVYLT